MRAQKQIRTLRKTELDSLYSEWLQRAPVEGQGAIIAAQATYMNYLAVQEATNSHDFEHKAGNYETWTGMNKDPDWTRYEH